MQTNHFIIATAGHVDHGKSSVVKALTGTDPDRLPEEKARGITIDLGFAHLDLPHPTNPEITFRIGIVDVPGHEDFVKNMVAGVGAINLALIVVAADDGWMPQTEEHLQILEYLGVKNGVVALTKMDLAAEGEEELIQTVREKLSNSPLRAAPIVPVSVMKGTGLTELKESLARELASIPAPVDCEKPRLSVDRVFALKGIGMVVTGTLTGGKLRKGETVIIHPRGAQTRVRNIQSHSEDVEVAHPGTRTALNMPDVAAVGEARGVQRGDVITIPGVGKAIDAIDVMVEKSARLAGQQKGAGRPLQSGMVLRWHYGSGNFPARVLLRGPKELGAGEKALAQLRFDEPIFVLAGERFILRDWSEQVTLGGGIVLDVDGVRERFRDAGQTRFLEQRAASTGEVQAAVCAQLERDKAVPSNQLLVQSVFSPGQIAQSLSGLQAGKKAVQFGGFVLEANWWSQQLKRGKEEVLKHHQQHPEKQGLPLSDLRAKMSDLAEPNGLFEAWLSALGQEGIQQTGTTLRAREHQQALPPQLEAAGVKLRRTLQEKLLDPPSRKELAPESSAQQALRFLLETREVVELSPEVVISRAGFERARALVVQHLRGKGPASASDLRQVLNSSRRVAIPLLEKFDKEGITRREGDLRVLGRNAA